MMSTTCHRVDIELPSIKVRRARPTSGRPERTSTIVTKGVDPKTQDDSVLYCSSERRPSRGRLCARFLVAEKQSQQQLCPRPPQDDKRILGLQRQIRVLQDHLEEKDNFIKQLVKRLEDASKTEPTDVNKEREIVNIISTLQARIEVLHQQWLEARSLVDIKEDYIRQLQTDLETSKDSEQHMRVLLERLRVQVQDLESQQKQWAEGKTALEGREQRIQQLELEVTSLKNNEQRHTELIDSLKKQVWDFEAQQAAWRAREAEVEGLREQLAAANGRVSELQAEARSRSLSLSLNSWEDKYNELMTKLQSVLGSGVDSTDAAVNKILGLLQEIATLKKTMEAQTQTTAQHQTENQRLLKVLDKLRADLATEKISVSSMTLELTNLRADRDSWGAKQSELEKELANIRVQLESTSVTEKRASQELGDINKLHEKERHSLVQRLSNLEKKYHDIVDKLRTVFGIDDIDINVILTKIQGLRKDNVSLRSQLASHNLVGVETQSLRNTIDRLRADLERERTAAGGCSTELSALRTERDTLLSKQKDLQLEIASLRHGSNTASHTLLSRDQQLDDLRARVAKLESDNSALEGQVLSHETKFSDFCEQLAALLSLQGQVTVLHTETAILSRLRQVIQELDEKALRALGLQSRVTSLTEELCEQCVQRRRDGVKQRRIQSDLKRIGTKLNKLETDMKDGKHLLCRGIPLHQDAYQVFLDRLADLFNVEVIAVDVGTDLSEDTLLVRAEEFARVQHSNGRSRTTVFRTPPRSANRSNGTCVLICSGSA